jgi:hypothetical protein
MSTSETYRPKFGFDIRIRPPRGERVERAEKTRRCEWDGCQSEAHYRAPKGRDRLNEHRWLCLDHVRAFNQSWNYFEGLSDEEVQAHQAAARSGDRPTWRFGTTGAKEAPLHAGLGGFRDAFGLFSGRRAAPERPERTLTKRQIKAFDAFGLDQSASRDDIRRQYKTLVKRFHPDAHGGDRGMEERLREVIEAYQVLKAGGFC